MCSAVFASGYFQSTPSASLTQNIATVDMEVVFKSPVFSDEQAKLNEKFKPENEALQQKAKDLKADFEALSKNRESMPADKIKTVETGLDKRRAEFVAESAKLSNTQLSEFQELSNKFINAVKQATKIVAEDKKLSLVITQSDATTPYVSKSLDITQQVIDKVKL